MRLRPDQLASHLQKSLAPVYLISGDVPLLVQESCDLIRARAAELGYQDRQVLEKLPQLISAAQTLSLFNDRQLLELRLPEAKPGNAGSQILQTYLQKIPTDKILLIVTSKLDAAAQKSAWFQAIEKAGVFLPLWPIDREQLPAWCRQRLAQKKLTTSPEALQLLAEKVEGNLLAAVQEIEKLSLIYGAGVLTLEQVASCICDSSRFDIFQFADSVLDGDISRIFRIFSALQAEQIEPVLILWALVRDIRLLIECASGVDVLAQRKVWERRMPLVSKAAKRYSVDDWQRLLQQAAGVDRIIKGFESGDVWNALKKLSLAMATSCYDEQLY